MQRHLYLILATSILISVTGWSAAADGDDGDIVDISPVDATAFVPKTCPEKNEEKVGGFSLHSRRSAISGQCNVWLGGEPHVGNTPYRSFAFSSRGIFQIFISLGDRRNSTGSRSYFLFPRKQDPSFEVKGEEIIVRGSWGGEIHFSSESKKILKIDGAHFIQDPVISPKNEGGISIKTFDGLMLDTGFAMGGTAYYRNPNGISTFQDRNATTCKVTNSKIFDYLDNENPVFKFKTDAELKEFLSQTCKQLDLSSLDSNASDCPTEATQPCIPTAKLIEELGKELSKSAR